MPHVFHKFHTHTHVLLCGNFWNYTTVLMDSKTNFNTCHYNLYIIYTNAITKTPNLIDFIALGKISSPVVLLLLLISQDRMGSSGMKCVKVEVCMDLICTWMQCKWWRNTEDTTGNVHQAEAVRRARWEGWSRAKILLSVQQFLLSAYRSSSSCQELIVTGRGGWWGDRGQF